MKIQLNQQELNQAVLEFVSKRHELQEGSTVAVTFTAQNKQLRSSSGSSGSSHYQKGVT